MAIGWKDGVNSVIDGLVARLVTLENQIKELIEDKAAKTKKIDDLEKELRAASNNSSTSSNNLTSVNDSWANILKDNNKMNEVQTNILNVVGNEQNQRRRKERNVMLFVLEYQLQRQQLQNYKQKKIKRPLTQYLLK